MASLPNHVVNIQRHVGTEESEYVACRNDEKGTLSAYFSSSRLFYANRRAALMKSKLIVTAQQ